MMRYLNADLRIALLAAGAFAIAPMAAHAQSSDVPSEPQQTQAQEEHTTPEPATADPTNTAEPVTEAKVDQFANAYAAVQAIQVKAAEELNATEDVEKANQVKATAEDQMIKAVEQSGLAIDEFNQIAQRLASDLPLRTRVIEKLQQKSKG